MIRVYQRHGHRQTDRRLYRSIITLCRLQHRVVKTTTIRLQGVKISRIHEAILTQYQRVTDRQRDGHLAIVLAMHTRHAVKISDRAVC